MPNFMWQRHLSDARHHVQLTLEQIGTTLVARRYFQGWDQDAVALNATRELVNGDPIERIEISNLENGLLPSRMRDDPDRLRAVYRALEFRDIDEYVAMVLDLHKHVA